MRKNWHFEPRTLGGNIRFFSLSLSFSRIINFNRKWKQIKCCFYLFLFAAKIKCSASQTLIDAINLIHWIKWQNRNSNSGFSCWFFCSCYQSNRLSCVCVCDRWCKFLYIARDELDRFTRKIKFQVLFIIFFILFSHSNSYQCIQFE